MTVAGWGAFLAAAGVGAALRYLVDGTVADRAGGRFPWGTFVVNATGSLLSGLLTGLALSHAFPPSATVVLATGFCGSYTTFSTFTFETLRLVEEGAFAEAVLNLGATATTCAAAAGAGLALTSAV